jgi:hypothetical protein
MDHLEAERSESVFDTFGASQLTSPSSIQATDRFRVTRKASSDRFNHFLDEAQTAPSPSRLSCSHSQEFDADAPAAPRNTLADAANQCGEHTDADDLHLLQDELDFLSRQVGNAGNDEVCCSMLTSASDSFGKPRPHLR